jgi:hypothetical protein
MGGYPEQIPAMKQTASSITHTRYEFNQSGVTLEPSCYSPALMSCTFCGFFPQSFGVYV